MRFKCPQLCKASSHESTLSRDRHLERIDKLRPNHEQEWERERWREGRKKTEPEPPSLHPSHTQTCPHCPPLLATPFITISYLFLFFIGVVLTKHIKCGGRNDNSSNRCSCLMCPTLRTSLTPFFGTKIGEVRESSAHRPRIATPTRPRGSRPRAGPAPMPRNRGALAAPAAQAGEPLSPAQAACIRANVQAFVLTSHLTQNAREFHVNLSRIFHVSRMELS